MAEQSYATHRRLDPLFHFVLATLYVVFFLLAARSLWKGSSLSNGATFILAIGLLIHWFKTRAYALSVQDRVIRLEERLRMATLLPEDLRGRAHELTPSQCVGLRFASDGELADLVRQTLAENLDGEAIKKRIKTWRPDHHRV
ncbi:MAG: hypothetical protein HYZ13_16545 [Acidobacteria bacterium]|nr:hypothetical protein [Acidobacteriota bacterium]